MPLERKIIRPKTKHQRQWPYGPALLTLEANLTPTLEFLVTDTITKHDAAVYE